MHTVNLLISLVEHHQVLAYVIIFLGLIFEGEIIAISVGILAHLGALNFWFSIFFILVGAISKTLIFYELGEFLYKFKKEFIILCPDLKINLFQRSLPPIS